MIGKDRSGNTLGCYTDRIEAKILNRDSYVTLFSRIVIALKNIDTVRFWFATSKSRLNGEALHDLMYIIRNNAMKYQVTEDVIEITYDNIVPSKGDYFHYDFFQDIGIEKNLPGSSKLIIKGLLPYVLLGAHWIQYRLVKKKRKSIFHI